jgi:hypothetical protein
MVAAGGKSVGGKDGSVAASAVWFASSSATSAEAVGPDPAEAEQRGHGHDSDDPARWLLAFFADGPRPVLEIKRLPQNRTAGNYGSSRANWECILRVFDERNFHRRPGRARTTSHRR